MEELKAQSSPPIEEIDLHFQASTRRTGIIQLTRHSPVVIHCQGEKESCGDYLYIGRPSKWGNIHPIKYLCPICKVRHTRDEAIQKYEDDLAANDDLIACLHELKGKTLGCWCKPKRCHGDILRMAYEFVYGV